jgi:hypothetical protein
MSEEEVRRSSDGDQPAVDGEAWWYDDGEGSVMPGLERLATHMHDGEALMAPRPLPEDDVI